MTHTTLSLRPIGALGAQVHGLEPGPLSADVVERLRRAMADHGVLVFSRTSADDAAFAALMASFGPAVFTAGETPVAGHPDLNVVSNVGRATPPRSVFHIDTSYLRVPPAYSGLHAVTVPEAGGETLFTDQHAAYDALDAGTRARLAGATVTHEASGMAIPEGEERSAEHPLFLRHPVSGRTALYLSTPARCTAVSRLPADEGRATIEALYEHSIRPPYALRHRWSQGDIVLWDNRNTLHRADHGGVVGDRILHRGMNLDAAALGTPPRSVRRSARRPAAAPPPRMRLTRAGRTVTTAAPCAI